MEWQADPHGDLSIEEWKQTKRLQRPTDPFTIERVDPDSIQYVTVYTDTVDKAQDGERHPVFTSQSTRFAGFFRTAQAGAVFRGEWDGRSIPFDQYLPYKGMRDHFKNGVAWEETQYYRNIVECIIDGAPLWGCETETEFRDRCSELDRLYRSIEQKGYQSAQKRQDGKLQYDEIAVNVGRDGHLLFNDGKHRLSIAKLLDIDTVPVRVIVRHQEWVANSNDEFPSVQ